MKTQATAWRLRGIAMCVRRSKPGTQDYSDEKIQHPQTPQQRYVLQHFVKFHVEHRVQLKQPSAESQLRTRLSGTERKSLRSKPHTCGSHRLT